MLEPCASGVVRFEAGQIGARNLHLTAKESELDFGQGEVIGDCKTGAIRHIHVLKGNSVGQIESKLELEEGVQVVSPHPSLRGTKPGL